MDERLKELNELVSVVQKLSFDERSSILWNDDVFHGNVLAKSYAICVMEQMGRGREDLQCQIDLTGSTKQMVDALALMEYREVTGQPLPGPTRGLIPKEIIEEWRKSRLGEGG